MTPERSSERRFTDDELIELVQSKTPEELSPEEITALRERLGESDRLREVLFSQIQFESHLSSLLAPVHISAEEIVERAKTSRGNGSAGRTILLLLAIAVTVAGLWGGVVWFRGHTGPLAGTKLAGDADTDSESRPAKTPTKPDEATDPATVDSDSSADPTDRGSVKIGGRSGRAVEAALLGDDARTVGAATFDRISPALRPGIDPEAPWAEAFDPTTLGVPFAEAAFPSEPIDRLRRFDADQFREWFEPVPGQTFKVENKEAMPKQMTAKFEGLAKLKAPWGPETVWELSTFDQDGFALRFFPRTEEPDSTGVLLRYHRRFPVEHWAAYEIERAEKPGTERIVRALGTDNHIHSRSRMGPFQVRWANGQLVLTTGRLPFLVVPLAGPPTDVFVSGKVVVWHSRMFRGTEADVSEALANRPDSPEPTVSINRPADEPWQLAIPDGTTFTPLADGGVTLAADHFLPEQARVFLPVDPVGFAVGTFEISDPTIGADVYLGDAEGKPLHVIGSFRDRGDDRVVLARRRGNETHLETDYDETSQIQPIVNGRLWLRIIAGSEETIFLISPDGEHFSRVLVHNQRHEETAVIGSIGLALRPSEQPRSITLHSLRLSELDSLHRLASPDLQRVAAGMPFVTEDNYSRWRFEVERSRPAAADPDQWRRACALQALRFDYQGRAGWGTSWEQVMALLQSVPEVAETPEEGFRMIDDLARLVSHWEGTQRDRFLDAYHAVGLRFAKSHSPEVALWVAEAIVQSPMWSHVDPELTGEDLLQAVSVRGLAGSKSSEIADVFDAVRFYAMPGNPYGANSFLDKERESFRGWVRVTTAAATDRSLSTEDFGRLTRWNPPAAFRGDKAGANIFADLETALVRESWADACRILIALPERGTRGLFRSTIDEGLSLSIRGRVALAMAEHPELREMLEDRYGDAALIRVREAITRGDFPRLEAITVRFMRTEAAAEAHHALGDRYMTVGEFERARWHYREALRSAPPEDRESLAAKRRLAAAFGGDAVGDPPSEPIAIGDLTLSPEDFERTIAGLLPPSMRENRSRPTPEVLPSARYTLTEKGRTQKPNGGDSKAYDHRDVDWIGRQQALVADTDRFYFSDRFQIAAHDLGDGRQLWRHALESGKTGKTHAWAGEKAVPVLLGDRVVVRRLRKEGFELFCCTREKGEPRWAVLPDGGFLTDPVPRGDRLLAVTRVMLDEDLFELRLVMVDMETGGIFRESTVGVFRDRGDVEPHCELTVTDDAAFVSCGGTLTRCDSLGEPAWRRQIGWFPPELDPNRRDRGFLPPIVRRDNTGTETVVFCSPDVKAVVAVDAETGRERWRTPVPTLIRPLGLGGDHLLVIDEAGLIAIHADTGAIAWTRTEPLVLELTACDEQQVLIGTIREESNGRRRQFTLAWLDTATGRDIAAVPIDLMGDKPPPRLGPMVRAGDAIWILQGDGGTSIQSRIGRMTVAEGEPFAELVPAESPPWSFHLTEFTRLHAGFVLPGWEFLSQQSFKGKFGHLPLLGEHRGERDVIQTMTGGALPVRFGRIESVPVGESRTLEIRCGIEDEKTPWTLAVWIDGEERFVRKLTEETTEEGWTTIRVPIPPAEHERRSIIIEQRPPPEKTVSGYWKFARIQ